MADLNTLNFLRINRNEVEAEMDNHKQILRCSNTRANVRIAFRIVLNKIYINDLLIKAGDPIAEQLNVENEALQRMALEFEALLNHS